MINFKQFGINSIEDIPTILESDFYKQSHAEQYPEGTAELISYATARMSRMKGQNDLVVFGIQAFIKRFLIENFNRTFFERDFDEAMYFYKLVMGDTFPLQYVDIEKFRELHKLGYLPIEVACLPEGTRVPIRSAFELPTGQCQVPFMYFRNTKPGFAWVTEFLESLASSEIWYPMCVANQAFLYRQIVNKWYTKTGVDESACKSAISEFGFRGGKGKEAATLASSAFLTSFNKTATIPAIIYNSMYYSEEMNSGRIGSGMISTEHSVMCSNKAADVAELYKVAKKVTYGGETLDVKPGDIFIYENEHVDDVNTFKIVLDSEEYTGEYPVKQGSGIVNTPNGTYNIREIDTEAMLLKKLLTEIYPTGAVSAVCDSWDYWNCVENILGKTLHNEVMSREGCLFVRGDSGDPVDILCGEQLKEGYSLFHSGMQVVDALLLGKCADIVYIDSDNKFYRVTKELRKLVKDKVRLDGVRGYLIECSTATPEIKGTVELLWDLFGGMINEAGYKVLNSHVRCIYGDSITPARAEQIYARLEAKGFAACNVALGAGSFSMNCIEGENGQLYPFTRDSYGIAVKATYAKNSNGEEYQLFKNPKTDTGKFKKSQKGLIHVRVENGEIVAYDGYDSKTFPKEENMLQVVFRDGKMIKETTLTEVRDRLHDNKF